MTNTLQEIAVAIVVLAALAYVAWRLVRFARRKGVPNCRCCQSCWSESPPLVALSEAKPARSWGGSSTATPAIATPTTSTGPSATTGSAAGIPDDPGRRGVIGVAVRDGRMLVIRRSRSVVAPLVFCFPGGGIEPGESEEQALVREFREEIGVTVRPLRRLWQCVTAWKVELSWWLVEIAADATPVPNPAEVESVHWLTPAEMSQLPDLLASNREFLAFARESGLFSGPLP